MAPRSPTRRRWYRRRAYRLARTVLVAVSLVAGGVRWAQGGEEPGETAVTAAPGASGSRTDGRVVRPAAGTPAAPSRPHPVPPHRATHLTIPYLGIDAPVMPLHLDHERRLLVPPDDDPNLVGWYTGGPSPGGQGTAVAVGHLDTDAGPAVFAGLSELKPGRIVEVRRADGRTAVYTVDALKSYEKDHFPDREVYGARSRPELRLITCGGSYDRRTGYSGNLVVFAHLTAVRPPGATAPDGLGTAR